MKRGSVKKANATTSGKMSAKTNAQLDVSGAKKNAEVPAEDVAQALGANDQWQAAVDPTTGSTYYYNPERLRSAQGGRGAPEGPRTRGEVVRERGR